jgi:hypothetical protein
MLAYFFEQEKCFGLILNAEATIFEKLKLSLIRECNFLERDFTHGIKSKKLTLSALF